MLRAAPSDEELTMRKYILSNASEAVDVSYFSQKSILIWLIYSVVEIYRRGLLQM